MLKLKQNSLVVGQKMEPHKKLLTKYLNITIHIFSKTKQKTKHLLQTFVNIINTYKMKNNYQQLKQTIQTSRSPITYKY